VGSVENPRQHQLSSQPFSGVAASNDLGDLRKAMRGFILRGQTRIHMAKESDPRRRAICDAICAAAVNATIYDAGQRYKDPLAARDACLSITEPDPSCCSRCPMQSHGAGRAAANGSSESNL
jgi:hypothetical protein